MLKFNRKNESGRSMVEMLGVLAIIGVLSVMGISGYTTAMRSHKANEIVAATSMAYIMGMSQNAGAGGSPMVYTPKPDGVTSITFTAQNQIEIAGITDAAVCAQVKGRFSDKVTGDCAASGSSTLTVTLGETPTLLENTPENFSNKDCSGHEGEKCYVHSDNGCSSDDPSCYGFNILIECLTWQDEDDVGSEPVTKLFPTIQCPDFPEAEEECQITQNPPCNTIF